MKVIKSIYHKTTCTKCTTRIDYAVEPVYEDSLEYICRPAEGMTTKEE